MKFPVRPAFLDRWLGPKWDAEISPDLARAYAETFLTLPGQRVLKHLVDNIYAQTYEGSDPMVATRLEGKRSVVHEILYNVDVGERPEKYTAKQESDDGG